MASLRPRDTYDPNAKADSRSGREGSVQNFSGERSASLFCPPSALHPFLSAWESSLGQRDSKAECQAPGSPSGVTFPPGWGQGPPTLPTYDCGTGKTFLGTGDHTVVESLAHCLVPFCPLPSHLSWPHGESIVFPDFMRVSLPVRVSQS